MASFFPAEEFGQAVAAGHLDNFSVMDGEGLHITGTASLMDSCQFSHNTFPLAGDPYPDLDDVTRSFDPSSAIDAEPKMFPCYDALGMVSKAWTGQKAELNLGCKNTWLGISNHDRLGIVDDAWTAWTEHNMEVNLDCNYKLLESHTVQYSRRFQVTDVPPGIPLNNCFRFAPTTYWLRGIHAHDIANIMLDFRGEKVVMTITKVSHTKFSIKANICIDGISCVAKLRVYSNNANSALALELQRRSGCGLVFNRFYQQVGYYLVACQKSVQLELLSALEGDSSTIWTNADLVIDDMAGKHNVPQFAWAHTQGLSHSDLSLDAE